MTAVINIPASRLHRSRYFLLRAHKEVAVLREHPLPDSSAFALTATAKPWTDRAPGECCWPVGDDEVQRSCCAPTDGGGYCADHLAAKWRGPARPIEQLIQACLRWAA